MKCENCKEEHKGNYGSGRFCSTKCARSFSSKEKRNEINKKVSKKLKGRKTGRCTLTNEQRLKGMLKSIQVSKERKENRILTEDFNKLSKKEKRERVRREQNNKCDNCGCEPFWNNNLLTFQLDHRDGNTNNNSRENLHLICPNCHTQTENFGSKNMENPGLKKVTDEEFIKALESTKNIRQALTKLKLVLKGGNYKRAYQLLSKKN